MITLSGLGHIAACPGSASLPRYRREGTRGTPIGHAIHEFIARAIEDRIGDDATPADIAKAHGLAPDDAGRLAFLSAHLSLPVPAGALAEVPLGYFPDGSVRRIEGGAGEYPDVGQLLSGTLDAMWAEPEPLTFDALGSSFPPDEPLIQDSSTLWIVDWKTGDEAHVPPVDRNWQLRAGAVMAARWTGARRVIPAICYVNAAECAEAVRAGVKYEGRWEVGAPLDAAALDAIEVELRAVLARARGEDDGDREDVCMRRSVGGDQVRGEGRGGALSALPPGPVEPSDINGETGAAVRRSAPLILGPHCEHCPARGACPALAAEALSLGRAEGLYLPPGAALTPAAASHLAGLLGPARRVLDAVEAAVQAHARAHGPIALPNGQEYGYALEPTESYETGPAFEALAARVGDERANKAFVGTADRMKAALREGLGVERLPRGAWDALRGEIEARGGVVPGVREVWRRRWPAKPVPPPVQ